MRLEREGLVEIRARSGIYLAGEAQPTADGQLHRLRRQWLEQVYNGGMAVGLDSGQILRIGAIVAEVERSRSPVLVSDAAEGVSIAEELHRRMGIRAEVVTHPDGEEIAPSIFSAASIAICTPWHVSAIARVAPQCISVPVTLSSEVFKLLQADDGGLTLLVAADNAQCEKIRVALNYFGKDVLARTVLLPGERVEPDTFERFPFRKVVLWPGARLNGRAPETVGVHVPEQLIGQEMLDALRRAILDVALRRFTATAS